MSTSALAPAAQDEIATLFVDAAGYRRHRHPYRPSARRAAASPVAASRTARSPHSIAADNFSLVRELILLGQGVGLLPASLCEADIAAGAVAAVLPSSSPERPDPPLRDREPQTLRWREIVWTPSAGQGRSWRRTCHVGCRFVSGLFARPMTAGLDGCPPPEAPIWISRLMRIPLQRVCLGSRSD